MLYIIKMFSYIALFASNLSLSLSLSPSPHNIEKFLCAKNAHVCLCPRQTKREKKTNSALSEDGRGRNKNSKRDFLLSEGNHH